MIAIMTLIALVFCFALFYMFYNRADQHLPENDMYIWVGRGKDPFRKH